MICVTPIKRTARVVADARLLAVKSYEFGMSRGPLRAVEDMVRAVIDSPRERARLAASLASLLDDSDTTLAAKDFVCRQLWLIGTAAEVPYVEPLLYDPATADMARYALERIPGARVDRALIAALGKTDGAVQAGIINTLGARRAQGARSALAELSRGPDPVVAEAARAALEKLGV
jgi:hypothetical protein